MFIFLDIRTSSFCISFITDTRKGSESNGTFELIITYSVGNINKTISFTSKDEKFAGANQTVCKPFNITFFNPNKFRILSTKIRQVESDDAWGAKELRIQKYPGSSAYLIFSMERSERKFWTDGDESCQHHDKFRCCSNLAICTLQSVPNKKVQKEKGCLYFI